MEFRKSIIYTQPFLQNALSYSFLKNVIRQFPEDITVWRPELERILSYNMRVITGMKLDIAMENIKTLSSRDMVFFIKKINKLFHNRNGWSIRLADLNRRLKEFDGRKFRKKKK